MKYESWCNDFIEEKNKFYILNESMIIENGIVLKYGPMEFNICDIYSPEDYSKHVLPFEEFSVEFNSKSIFSSKRSKC